MLKRIVLLISFLVLWAWVCLSQNFWNEIWNDNRFSFPYDEQPVDATDSTDISTITKQQVVQPRQSLIWQLMNAFNINYSTNTKWEFYVKKVVNYFLAIVSVVALVVLIYGFYMVFLWNSEENLKKARKYIFLAATSLFIMWVSWFIISWIFEIFFRVRG